MSIFHEFHYKFWYKCVMISGHCDLLIGANLNRTDILYKFQKIDVILRSHNFKRFHTRNKRTKILELTKTFIY